MLGRALVVLWKKRQTYIGAWRAFRSMGVRKQHPLLAAETTRIVLDEANRRGIYVAGIPVLRFLWWVSDKQTKRLQ
jgi:hypothetical protein